MTDRIQPSPAPPRHAASRIPAPAKVPEITALFWVIKVLTTGMGESAADFLGKVSIPLAGLVAVLCLVVGLGWQLLTTRYRPVAYWTAVAAVAVFGTGVADILHILGVPYTVTTPFYALVLAVVLGWWYAAERTLSIHTITTRRRELFYWATVLATFALGTAAGDLTAASLHLGFLVSGLLFGAAILVPLVAWRLGLDPVLAFWTAYVLTRPLGASFADWIGKPAAMTGLGYGDGTVTAVALTAFVVLVGWVAVSGHGVQVRRAPESAWEPDPA